MRPQTLRDGALEAGWQEPGRLGRSRKIEKDLSRDKEEGKAFEV